MITHYRSLNWQKYLMRLSLTYFLTLFAFSAMTSAFANDKPARPNIVFILADDLGWADTTLYGHTSFYKTPHIEALAKRGMTFDHAYTASPLCSPTRSSILTGMNPARTGLTTPNCHLPQVILKASTGEKGPPNKKSIGPNSVSRLDTKHFTLAEAMKEAGYATGHFDKWHLGKEPYSPLEHGFDVDVPHWAGPGPAGSFVAPWKFPDFDADTPNQHIEDRMAKEAVAFIEQHKDEPFFLNYWMFSVHAPFDAKPDLIEKYRKSVDPKDPQRSPTYAAMVESMDDAVGTLMNTLDRLKIADNTIVIFFSDNGGNMYNTVDDTTPTSNAPLRGGKASMFEGGVRVPLIVSWPGIVTPASRNASHIHSDDFYPTLLDMLNLKAQPDQIFDGVSFLPALKGNAHERGPSFTYFPHDPPVPDWIPPSVSVHEGDWKLIRIFHGGENGAHRWKLFNLAEDIGEAKNLADTEPERLKQLDTLIEDFLDNTKAARPVPNPSFKPALYIPGEEGLGKIRTPSAATKPAPKATAPKANAASPKQKATTTKQPNVIVIFTDDHGYSDLSCQGVYDDVKTPHIDALATGGVRMTDGYSTAPQCVPSRGGILSGQYQNRFGLESNPEFQDQTVMQRFGDLSTVAERMQSAGYATGMAGKWHLGPDRNIAEHGFDKTFVKNSNAPGFWNMDLDGKDLKPTEQTGGGYHLDLIADFACAFIDRHKDQPFYFYLAPRAPHVPLDAPPHYLKRFPGKMPERRRQALAMLSAVDDGVGRIMETLRKNQLEENTLIFLIGDNGAPLKIHKLDAPGGGPGWDGSLNDPMNGEKGMLAEGGIRTPFVAYWKGTIPGGQIYRHPVISIDTTASAIALAGLPDDPQLDGVNLLPYLTGAKSGAPHETLYWRWLDQSAIRQGDWKFLRGSNREYLFNLKDDVGETNNLITQHAEKAKALKSELSKWATDLIPPGLDAMSTPGMNKAGSQVFDWYLDGKRDIPIPTVKAKPAPTAKASPDRSQEKLFQQRDKDRDGKVTWEEFLAGRGPDKVPALKKVFAARDRNHNGVWEKSELPR